jgi:hypothetical protein
MTPAVPYILVDKAISGPFDGYEKDCLPLIYSNL